MSNRITNQMAKHWGNTNTLLKLGNIVYNVLCHYLFYINPTFSAFGLLFVLSFTYILCAILEIPCLYFVDRFGVKNAIIGSFLLRYIGLVNFALSIYSGYLNPDTAWILLFVGTIIDALSISLLSHWPKRSTTNKSPVTLILFILLPIAGLAVTHTYYNIEIIFVSVMIFIKISQGYWIWKETKDSPNPFFTPTKGMLQRFQMLHLHKNKMAIYSYAHIVFRMESIYFLYTTYQRFNQIGHWSILVLINLLASAFILFMTSNMKKISLKQIPLLITILCIFQFISLQYLNLFIHLSLVISIASFSLFLMENLHYQLAHKETKPWISLWFSTTNILTFGSIGILSAFCLLGPTPILSSQIMSFFLILLSIGASFLIPFINEEYKKFYLKNFILILVSFLLLLLGSSLCLGILYFYTHTFPIHAQKWFITSLFVTTISVLGVLFFLFSLFKRVLSLIDNQLLYLSNPKKIDQMPLNLIQTEFIVEEFYQVAISTKNYINMEKKYQNSSGAIRAIEVIAHDIRRPIMNMKVFLDCLTVIKTKEDIEMLTPLKDEVNNQFSSVDLLLTDLVQLNIDKLLCFEYIHLSSFLDKTAQAILKTNKSKHFYHLECSLLYYTSIDCEKFKRVIENILINALESMEMMGNGQIGHIWLTCKKLTSKYSYEMSFKNSLTYIEKIDIPLIFIPHFSKGKKQGSGLGLSICQKIIMDHGGEIYCTSEKDTVSFVILLP